MALSYGLKVSKEGSNVLTASEANLQFTSMYPVLKAIDQGQVSTTGGSWYTVTHNLGFSPSFLVWAKGSGNSYRFQIPRFVVGTDPVGSQKYLQAYSTTTTLRIITENNSDVYYYIFVDPI